MNAHKAVVTTLLVLLATSKTLQQKALKDLPEECFTATTIYDDTRVFGYNEATTDDLQLRKGWYRIGGRKANSLKEGFTGLFSKKNEKTKFCGSKYPGTLMSTHPTVEEGIVAMVVCFREKKCFNENISKCKCKSKRMIYARNCLRHYIYWLVPTARHEKYCTSKTWLAKPITSSNVSDALECHQYKNVRDGSRMWDSMSRITSENVEGWVRFDKLAGTNIASKCIVSRETFADTEYPCGTKFRGWIYGSHPSLEDGRVIRRVCFSYVDRCDCEVSSNIAVRNCGNFFVYFLRKPPIENARFCGSALDSSSSSMDKSRKSKPESKNICYSSKTVRGIDRLWSNTDPTVSKCDATLYGIYRFTHNDMQLAIKEGCMNTDVLVIETRCATRYQGYMEGRHPTVSEGYVERIICFQSNLVPCECHFTALIGVQNCGDKYVYDLKGVPLCDARFCMEVHNKPNTLVTSSQSVKGAPSNYEPRVEALKRNSNGVTIKDNSVPFTTLLLFVILIFLLIFLIILILVVVLIIRPLIRDNPK